MLSRKDIKWTLFWFVLIVVIVTVVVSLLTGVFIWTGQPLTKPAPGYSCFTSVKYACQVQSYKSGTLILTLVQQTGNTWTNVSFYLFNNYVNESNDNILGSPSNITVASGQKIQVTFNVSGVANEQQGIDAEYWSSHGYVPYIYGTWKPS